MATPETEHIHSKSWRFFEFGVSPRIQKKLEILPPNQGSKWTDDDDRQLAELFHNAVDFRDIATHFGRTRGAITSRLKQLGLLKPLK